jgi:hypothetical protein
MTVRQVGGRLRVLTSLLSALMALVSLISAVGAQDYVRLIGVPVFGLAAAVIFVQGCVRVGGFVIRSPLFGWPVVRLGPSLETWVVWRVRVIGSRRRPYLMVCGTAQPQCLEAAVTLIGRMRSGWSE